MTGELTEAALRRSVREKVFSDAQASVINAVELFLRFVEKHNWSGHPISPRSFKLPSGAQIKMEVVGKYLSRTTSKEWLIGLQPRQDDAPNDDQFQMWRSALCYEFFEDDDSTMIVDLSKNLVSQKRELREITSRKFPLLPLDELRARLELVVSCYRKAVEIVPERPERFGKHYDEDPKFDF